MRRLALRPDIDVFGAEVVFGELLANAVRHGGGGAITVTVREFEDEPIIAVRDDGGPFRPTAVPKDALMAEHGRGMALVAQFAREVQIRSADHGKEVVARLRTSEAA